MVDAPGDLTLWAPGSDPNVHVEADAGGNVPQRGDAVAPVSESARGLHVTTPTAAGTAIGTLKQTPKEFDETATYATGDVVGDTALLLRHYVDWFQYDETGGWDQTATDPTTTSPAVGNFAATDADGSLIQYDSASHVMPLGIVWRTTRFADYTAGKIAVARYR